MTVLCINGWTNCQSKISRVQNIYDCKISKVQYLLCIWISKGSYSRIFYAGLTVLIIHTLYINANISALKTVDWVEAYFLRIIIAPCGTHRPTVGPRVTHCGSHCAMQHDFKNGLLWFCLLCIQLCFVVLYCKYCKCHWNRCSVTLRMVCCVVSSQSFVNEELLLSGSSIFSIFRLVSKVINNLPLLLVALVIAFLLMQRILYFQQKWVISHCKEMVWLSRGFKLQDDGVCQEKTPIFRVILWKRGFHTEDFYWKGVVCLSSGIELQDGLFVKTPISIVGIRHQRPCQSLTIQHNIWPQQKLIQSKIYSSVCEYNRTSSV